MAQQTIFFEPKERQIVAMKFAAYTSVVEAFALMHDVPLGQFQLAPDHAGVIIQVPDEEPKNEKQETK